jgi:hypothetical protein
MPLTLSKFNHTQLPLFSTLKVLTNCAVKFFFFFIFPIFQAFYVKSGLPGPSFRTQYGVQHILCINNFVIVSSLEVQVFDINKPENAIFRDKNVHEVGNIAICCDQSRIVYANIFADFDYSRKKCIGCNQETVVFDESGVIPWRSFGENFSGREKLIYF